MTSPIKIYNGDKVLHLQHKLATAHETEDTLFFKGQSESDKVVDAFINGAENHIYYTGEKPLELLKCISKAFKYIEAAGGLVKNTRGQYLFIYRLDKWDLPKGKAEKGESPAGTAVREVIEETGLESVDLIQPLINTYHIYPHKGKVVLKCTYWFDMLHKGTGEVIPQTTENIDSVVWLDKSQFSKVFENTYPSVVDVIDTI